MVHPDDRERVMDATNKVFHEHIPYSHDERIYRPDGSVRHLHTWAHPLLDENGKLPHLIGVCQDITDRVAAEDAVRELNQDLERRAIVERTAGVDGTSRSPALWCEGSGRPLVRAALLCVCRRTVIAHRRTMRGSRFGQKCSAATRRHAAAERCVVGVSAGTECGRLLAARAGRNFCKANATEVRVEHHTGFYLRMWVIAFLFAHASTSGAQRLSPQTGTISIPLAGDWRLNLARTHYGPGVDVRRSEHLSCAVEGSRIRCVIRSVRANGQELIGRFAATLDGVGSPVTGIPDIDEVQLRRPSDTLLDATFLTRGKPVFGYRALQSEDGRSLMIISVDPVSRVALTSVVVYDRR